MTGKSALIIPAELPEEKAEEIRRLAVKAFKALDCSGMARIDFFVERDTQMGVLSMKSIPYRDLLK